MQDQSEPEPESEPADPAQSLGSQPETTLPDPGICAVPRLHDLATDPTPGEVWRYTPRDASRLAAEVCLVAAGNSFVERVLRVITRDGQSKNFEEITGQDGLTFGITDFAGDSGCLGFFRDLQRRFPRSFAAAFGPEGAQLLDEAWVRENNGGGHAEGNNAGLIRFAFVRRGLAMILGHRGFRGYQLARFVRGKITPCLKLWQAANFRREFTLAAMIGIANSFGPSGMNKKFLQPALARAGEGADREEVVARDMLRRYVERELSSHPATETLLRRALGTADPGQGPAEGGDKDLPRESQLGHRGRRVLALVRHFPFAEAAPFSGLGRFTLAPEEAYPDEPCTACEARG